jgi:hypothetical protein
VSHCSKNQRGAEAFAAFTTVIRTMAKKATASIADHYCPDNVIWPMAKLFRC